MKQDLWRHYVNREIRKYTRPKAWNCSACLRSLKLVYLFELVALPSCYVCTFYITTTSIRLDFIIEFNLTKEFICQDEKLIVATKFIKVLWSVMIASSSFAYFKFASSSCKLKRRQNSNTKPQFPYSYHCLWCRKVISSGRPATVLSFQAVCMFMYVKPAVVKMLYSTPWNTDLYRKPLICSKQSDILCACLFPSACALVHTLMLSYVCACASHYPCVWHDVQLETFYPTSHH